MLIQPARSQLGLVRGTVVLLENSITLRITEQHKRMEFALSLVFYPPSLYSWYTLDTVDFENPSYLTIPESEWPMRCAPMIRPQSTVSKSGSLPILAFPTTNSEPALYLLYIQLP
ncbi:uncharacterized protein TNCV_1675591 [Trichonephila clavipes]|nr:uncharacterized protein TNCV_1675591 [Trichonephila clavipes]